MADTGMAGNSVSTKVRRGVAVLVAAAVVGSGMVVAPTSAIAAAGKTAVRSRTERVLTSGAGVQVSWVELSSPLPEGTPAHSAACDSIGYVRYRSINGPTDPQKSDGVVIAQQGFSSNSYNSDSVARNSVIAASASGRSIEYWNLARRSDCMNDDTGLDAALKAGDYRLAVDYYYRGKEINGRKFAGFAAVKNDPLMAEFGLARTVRDQYDLMLHELPDQNIRKTKAFCDGISFGGLLTGMFAAWDFDGNAATTADAGYNQCAGFIAQDTFMPSDPVGLQTIPILKYVMRLIAGKAEKVVTAGLRKGILPRTTHGLPIFSPDYFHLQRMAGLAAHLAPKQESDLLKSVPRSWQLDTMLKLTFAPTYTEFLTGVNTIRDYRFTNEALLGTMADNNSANISLQQASVGALAGGPTRPKTFPLPGVVSEVPAIGDWLGIVSGYSRRVAPLSKSTLYTWRNYNDVAGVGFTSPDEEVTDIRDLSRQLAQGSPAGYWEDSFPIRLLTDVMLAFAGSRDGDLSSIRYENAARDGGKPAVTILAGNSPVKTASFLFLPKERKLIPGYTHVDTINAATRQNNGKLDPSAQYLSDFVLAGAGAAGGRCGNCRPGLPNS